MPNIGIDLGTTHSLVAVVLSGAARVLLDDDERALLPSAVRVGDDGVPKAVGFPALEAAGDAGGTTFTSFKRFMGRGASDVAEEARLFRYDLVEDDLGMVRFRTGPRTINPVELSSFMPTGASTRSPTAKSIVDRVSIPWCAARSRFPVARRLVHS